MNKLFSFVPSRRNAIFTTATIPNRCTSAYTTYRNPTIFTFYFIFSPSYFTIMTNNKKTLFFKADLGNSYSCLINKRDISTVTGATGMLWTNIKMKTKEEIKITNDFDLLQSELLDLQDVAED